MKPLIRIVVIVMLIALGAIWYVHRARMRALNSGDVYVREQPSEKAKPVEPPAPSVSQPSAAPEVATSTPTPSEATPTPKPAQPQTLAVPASDSIPRNPPNGAVFAGTGKFQLYRQGDITWRLNSETGEACILFATDAQWHKTRIYQHGCGVMQASR